MFASISMFQAAIAADKPPPKKKLKIEEVAQPKKVVKAPIIADKVAKKKPDIEKVAQPKKIAKAPIIPDKVAKKPEIEKGAQPKTQAKDMPKVCHRDKKNHHTFFNSQQS